MTTADLQMVVTDLDGTFLGADGWPTRLNIQAMQLAADRGVQLVFATGRPARWLDVLDELLPYQPRAITSNGGMIVDPTTKQVLDVFPLPVESAAQAMSDLAEVLPGVGFAIEYPKGWGATPAWQAIGRDILDATIIRESPLDLLEAGQPIKLLAATTAFSSEELARRAGPVIDGRLNYTFSMALNTGLLECSAPGVTKASALRQLLSETGVDAANVAAFGDMPNDIEMLDLVGMPYAMSNAHPLLLARGYGNAGHHTDSGVGRTILSLLGDESPETPKAA
jgi:Cof subfamily protein (haloacid dehalogenase superfamily)